IAGHAAEHPEAAWQPSLLELKPYVEQLDAYFNGGVGEVAGPLDLVGSDFPLKVWEGLLGVPDGGNRGYGQIRKTRGQARASRAVGLANNQNPIAIVVPCHRVIGADGSMTGYGGGVPKKRWLLEHEATHSRRMATQGELFAGAAREGSRRSHR